MRAALASWSSYVANAPRPGMARAVARWIASSVLRLLGQAVMRNGVAPAAGQTAGAWGKDAGSYRSAITWATCSVTMRPSSESLSRVSGSEAAYSPLTSKVNAP